MEHGKDKYKYEKIYHKKGKLLKVRKGVKYEKSWDEADNSFKTIWKKYGSGDGNYKNEIASILDLKVTSVLDVGCGWNSFVETMRPYIEKAVGVDFACPAADVIASAHNLPFDEKSFDLITSWDCMEHIPEEEVPMVIEEFSRVGSRVYLKITTAPSATRIDGEELHVCVKDPDWWNEQIEKHFNIKKSQFNESINKPAKNHLIIYAVSKD